MSETVMAIIAIVISNLTIIFNVYRFGYSRGEQNERRRTT